MKQIFSTVSPSVIKFIFFLSTEGKLYQIWVANKDSIRKWDFNAENLKRYPFRELALHNPQDFKELYYILKEHDEKMFPIIHSVLEEVQQLFNFN